jgi:hypothetical protein
MNGARLVGIYTMSMIKLVLKGLGWSLIGAGAVGFWVGDKALHEFAHLDSLTAEAAGIFGSIFLLGVGFLLAALAERP